MNYEIKPGRIEISLENEYDGETLLQFLQDMHQSKKNRYLLVLNRQILINRKPAENENVVLSKNDRITILQQPAQPDFACAEKECRVVYEDDLVYVAHKDAGIIVHGNDSQTDCLANQAAAYQINHGIQAPVRYIHRLDKDTSGVVLFVKVPFFQPWYDWMLEEKQIQRHYLAICVGRGHVGQHFTYNQKIGKDRHVSGKYRFSNTGVEAVTKVEIIAKKKDYELISCELETGRTHQIRVHLSGNRHPIVNDPLYGVASHDFNGMGLWADQITFPNPITHQIITARDFPNPDFNYFSSER